MKKLIKKPLFQQLVTVILSVIFILVASLFCKYTPAAPTDESFEKATVLEVIAEQTQQSVHNTTTTTVVFKAEVNTGEFKGQSFNMTQLLDEMSPPVPKKVSPGDKILVIYQEPTDSSGIISGWSYAGANHTFGVVLLVLSFLIAILLIGRTKGISTIISLVLTIWAVFALYIPSVLLGQNIYVWTIIVTMFVIFSSLCILNGWNSKTLCAIVGNAGGILASGVLAFYINRAFGITGILDQDYLFLTMLEGGTSINLPALIWGSILIGSLGAIMDVAMSLASAMYELSTQMHKPSFKKLVISGMNIGRDAIGTMTNTLILAYVGGSIATILLFAAYTQDIALLLNYEMLLVEVIQSIVGSIGILLAVPITVFFSAWVFLKTAKNNDLSVNTSEPIVTESELQ